MKNIILTVLFIVCCSINGRTQITPDSLKGYYVGQYYFKYDSDTNWTVSVDTVFVTNIDTNGCWVSCYGDIGVFNAANFETSYSFCPGSSTNLFTRFYNADSLWINYEHISMPPPNIDLFSKIFKGKKAGVLTGIKDVQDYLSFNLYPNPADDKIYLSSKNLNQKSIVNIYNLKGQLVFTETISDKKEQYEMNILDLQNGIYFINLISNGKSFSSKFIKQ